MGKRYFTVQEARDLLPSIRELMGRALLVSGRLEQYAEAVRKLAESAPLNTGSPEGTAYLGELIVLQSCVARIQETGCLIKGLQEGLVDFPHLREGREVYLCWKYDEEDIHYWHEVDAGFAGRTPLLE